MEQVALPRASVLHGFRIAHAYHPKGVIASIIASLAKQTLTREGLNQILQDYDVESLGGLKSDLVDLVLFYARDCLQDHALDDEEKEAIRYLNWLFQISEGDFYALRKDRVRTLLTMEMEHNLPRKEFELRRATRDGERRREYAEYEVELQRLFGLSYDQFVELSRKPLAIMVEQAIRRFRRDGEVTEDEKAELFRDLLSCDTLYKFTPDELRLLNNGLSFDVPGRDVPPSVREAVFKRDDGRCQNCGSDTNLEFDHIISVSKGGSNTFANIQLLCRSCNRRKGSGF